MGWKWYNCSVFKHAGISYNVLSLKLKCKDSLTVDCSKWNRIWRWFYKQKPGSDMNGMRGWCADEDGRFNFPGRDPVLIHVRNIGGQLSASVWSFKFWLSSVLASSSAPISLQLFYRTYQEIRLNSNMKQYWSPDWNSKRSIVIKNLNCEQHNRKITYNIWRKKYSSKPLILLYSNLI